LVYVADSGNNRIRVATTSGLVSNLAGNGTATWADGTGAAASFRSPDGVATYPGSGIIYVADRGNHRIRKLTPFGVTTTFAASGSAAWADGQGTSARFYNPIGLTQAVDSAGVVYVADTYNNRIRLITPVGAVTTLALTDHCHAVALPVTAAAPWDECNFLVSVAIFVDPPHASGRCTCFATDEFPRAAHWQAVLHRR
jgi:hypothetical protein